MTGNERVGGDVKSKETGFPFSFEDCQTMFEKMSECCGDTGTVFDCCPMIRKMRNEKSGKSKAEKKERKKK
jgi:hypothetical protein